MKGVYFVLVKEFDVEELVTLSAYVTDRPAYKDRYMAYLMDTVNNEVLFYESHTSREVLVFLLEACIEDLGYIIFSD